MGSLCSKWRGPLCPSEQLRSQRLVTCSRCRTDRCCAYLLGLGPFPGLSNSSTGRLQQSVAQTVGETVYPASALVHQVCGPLSGTRGLHVAHSIAIPEARANALTGVASAKAHKNG